MAETEGLLADENNNNFVDWTSDLGSRIQVSLDFLCQNSTNLPSVLVHLLSNGLLSRRESEVIENQGSSHDGFFKLFTSLIPRVGHADASQHFVHAFQHSGNEHILEKLQSAIVTRDFPPRPPDILSSQSVRFNVREPAESFVGRENFLEQLHQQILRSQRTAADVPTISTILSRISVVTGLGGIGKSETIRMYIHRYGGLYHHVVWIDAEEETTAENQLRRLALQELQLPSKDIEGKAKDFSVILKDIYNNLCTTRTLLVLDNAEAFHDSNPQRPGVARFLPASMPPTHLKPVIVITSRQLDWPDLQSTSLQLFSSQESRAFIFRQLKLEESDANAKDAETLSETFGGLPLALQAAVTVIRQESKRKAFLGKDVYSIHHLLLDYSQGKRHVLNNPPPGSPDAPPLMLLWKVSLDKIQKQPHGHLATQILNVMAHLLPTNVPKELLFFIFNSDDEQSLEDALALLVDYSFLHDSPTHFSIHRMLQDVTLAHLEASAEEHSQKGSMNLWCCWTPSRTPTPGSRRRSSSRRSTASEETPPLIRITKALMEYWPTLPKSSQAYDAVHGSLVHVTKYHVLSKVQKNPSETDRHFIAFIEFVLKEIKKTRSEEAELCCRVLLTYFTSAAPPSRSDASLFPSQNFKKVQHLRQQLARILETMGRYKEALDICQEFLSSVQSLRPQNQRDFLPQILATKHSLALILCSQGDYEKAMKLCASVIDLRSKLYGPTHKSTLETKNNLAMALEKSGQLSEAMALNAEILEVRMRDPGPLHPDTLTNKHNMGVILEKEGRYEEALEMQRAVVAARERELGPLHAHTLISTNCLAVVLKKQGKDADALRLYDQIISRYERASAASHPDCLVAKHNMARLLEKVGRVAEAKEMFCHVLDTRERLLGRNHRSTLNTKNALAGLVGRQGKRAEALKLYDEVLEARTSLLGSLHPNTLQTNNAIGWLHLEAGDFKRAEGIAKPVLAARQATLSTDHPDYKDTAELYEKARLRIK